MPRKGSRNTFSFHGTLARQWWNRRELPFVQSRICVDGSTRVAALALWKCRVIGAPIPPRGPQAGSPPPYICHAGRVTIPTGRAGTFGRNMQ